MPYLSEKIKIAGTKFDRRVKLTPEDKKQIRLLYDPSSWSMRKLAARYGVSRRLIQFVIYPERDIKLKAERNWKDYYTKDKQRNYMKLHRRYKQKLHLDKKI